MIQWIILSVKKIWLQEIEILSYVKQKKKKEKKRKHGKKIGQFTEWKKKKVE